MAPQRGIVGFTKSPIVDTGSSNVASPASFVATGERDSVIEQNDLSGAIRHSTTTRASSATIQNLGGGLVLVDPLHVLVEDADDEFLASSVDLALMGRGETSLDAIDDLRDQVRELFEALTEMRESLGPKLRDQLAFLERLARIKI